jgi:hypothetical protein
VNLLPVKAQNKRPGPNPSLERSTQGAVSLATIGFRNHGNLFVKNYLPEVVSGKVFAYEMF